MSVCQQSKLHSTLSCTPENKADLTLKKVGIACLGLNECPGFKGIPQASWQAQSQILKRRQRATRIWRRGTGKYLNVKGLILKKNILQKSEMASPSHTPYQAVGDNHGMTWTPLLTHFSAQINTLGFHRGRSSITKHELRCISGAESRHSGYKLRNQSTWV